MLARTAAGVLSDKLDTEVKIKTFYIKPDLRLHAEEVQVNDKMHLPMFYVGYVDAKVSLRDLRNELRVKRMTLDDVLVNLVVYEDEYFMNVLDLFGSNNEADTDDKKKFDSKVHIEDFNLSKGHIVVWNQNKDKPEKLSMDYGHLDIDSIYMSANSLSFVDGVITGNLNNLSAAEKSGFVLDKFSSKSKFTVSSKGFEFKNLVLNSHETYLDLDLQFVYNNYRSFLTFVDSIMIIANIRPSQLTLSDLKYFSPTMGKMTDTLQIKGNITGTVTDFTANNFEFSFKDSTNFLGTIRMKGLPNFFETHIVGHVEKMNFTYQDISEFAIPTPDRKIPIPENLATLKNALLSGEFYGFHNNFKTTFNLYTNLGNIFIDGNLNNDLLTVSTPNYKFALYANNLKVNDIVGMKNDMTLTLSADVSGEGFNKESADIDMNFEIDKFNFYGNEFKDFVITANMCDQKIKAKTGIDSDLLKFDLDGIMNISHKVPSFYVNLDIPKADLYKLNLLDLDKKMILSTNVKADLRGTNIDKMYGTVFLDNTTYSDSRGSYFMDSLNLALNENYFGSKDVMLNCDFFDIDVNGIFHFKNIGNTFKNYVINHFHVNKWGNKGVRLKDEKQDFYVNMTFKNTETLSRLLMPNLKVSENTNFTATFTSNNYQLHSTLESGMIMFNKMIINDLHLKSKTEKDRATMTVSSSDFIIKESTDKNPIRLGLENIVVFADAHTDSLLIDLQWDDKSIEDLNKGKIEAVFLPHERVGGRLHISSQDMIINDSLWNISPTCYIDFKKNKISFTEFDIYSGNQLLSVGGDFPRSNRDTLYLKFNELDISDFDLLTKGYGIDIDGFINGDLQLAGLSEKFTFLSNLDVDGIKVNKHDVGNASINAVWNAPDTSIYIIAEIDRENFADKILTLNGKYNVFRKNNNLDFDLQLNDIDISLVNAFTRGVLSRIEGELGGDFLISGSFKKPVITGNAMLNDAACKIDYLNTYYRVNPSSQNERLHHTIKLSENRIDFQDIVLVDTLNNYAVAKGVVTHNYLKDFNFNVDATLDNFLGMNMLQEESSTFYGTAIASGELKIDGPLDDIVMDINALSMPGTVIDIVLTSTSSINDNFIVFVQKDVEQDVVKTIVPTNKKDKKFTFNLNADVTQDAKVFIHLPSNMGTIEAKGTGDIRLGLASDQLSLYGDYVIDDGTFTFNFQNLVRRNFDIKQGGTITWTGSAADADINVTGSYRAKSSISSLGIEMDSTSLVNNINVDCILRLQEKLTNPTITFGLSLPNATDDINNTVFSVIDTTNQAVMSQQIISLLVLGSFSYSNASLYSIGASNYYNVLTSSLSSWLSQISKDLDIGVKYTPEDNLTAEELEVALSTQLFDDKLTIEGNLGMYTGTRNDVAGGASNIVGDVDITYKFTNRLSLKIYNHSNLNSNYYSYTYEAYSDYTQGIGISYSQSFDNIREIFTRSKKKKVNKKNKR